MPSPRKPRPSPPAATHASPPVPRAAPWSVLVASGDGASLLRVGAAAKEGGGVAGTAQTAAGARALLAAKAWDVVAVDLRLGDDAAALAETASAGRACTSVVMLAEAPTAEQAIEAMRRGAADLVSPSAPDLPGRLGAAAARARRLRAREERVERLRRVCRTLNQARREVTLQVGSLCEDMVSAYQDLTDQLADLRLSNEFSAQIDGDLDVENLLRTALEFILTKTGPTNGAIFLPSSAGDFSVGAYVNCTCPRDTVEVLLDNLAGAASARLERHEGVRTLDGAGELADFLGPAADWMGDSAAMMFSCRHDEECLAVVALFRDRRNPFPRALERTLGTIGSLFGQHLARVIRIHHRHLPKGQWDAAGDGEDEGYGQAA